MRRLPAGRAIGRHAPTTPPVRPGAARVLIVNADDFGLSPGVNRGVITAHEQGIVTSASLLVRHPSAEEAAAYGRAYPRLSLGLHFDQAEWLFHDDLWTPLYERVPADDAAAVQAEASLQLATFRRLVGRDPTHIDSHQHVHRSDPTRSVLLELARGLNVPLRECTPGITYCGRFYGQTGRGAALPESITLKALLAIITTLPSGVTELGCHPGLGADADSTYGAERFEEMKVLCAPELRAVLAAEGITLRSFST